jgi:23S rRNA (guanosine2251-2'-O)-methyltransferase
MAIIYGINPVCEALESGAGGIRKVIVARGRGGENLSRLLKLAEQRKIEVEFREREYLDRLTGRAAHQGVLCFVPEFSYAGVEDVIEHRLAPYRDSLVLVLDSVTDPQNLGTLIRSAHCFGVNGVIIPENRAASVNPAAVKASAGATQRTLIARVVNIASAIDTLKERGFWIYGAEAEAGEDIRRVDYQGHVALVMGSEGKGLRPLVKKKCDFLISIPMGGQINSLNVSVAAGVILFDIFTKRLTSARS